MIALKEPRVQDAYHDDPYPDSVQALLAHHPRGLPPALVHGAAIAFFVAITVVYTLPLALHADHVVAPDPVDPLFHIRSIASLLRRTAPRRAAAAHRALAACHLAYHDAQEAICTGPWTGGE